jgi:hypothetical protein
MTRTFATARVMALLVALAFATLAWMFSAPPDAAAALAPTQTAWWNVANQPGAPPLPPPNDVNTSKHDLYVQGAGGAGGPNPGPVPPQNNAQGAAQAVAAIHYEIADGAAVQKLTLKVTGNKPPSAPGVVACRITDLAFRSEDNGPASDIPKYDCGTQATGTQNAAGDLEFKDIGKLVKGSELLIILVPGQLDRVVFAHPDAAALQVSAGYTQPAPVAQPATVPDYSSSSISAPADSGSASSSTSYAPLPPVAAPLAQLPLPAPLPTQAPSGGARRVLVTPPAAGSARIPLSPQQTRLVVGAATLASIAAFAAMVLVGPRMNAPVAGRVAADGGENVRGVGRFVRPRTGRPPPIW